MQFVCQMDLICPSSYMIKPYIGEEINIFKNEKSNKRIDFFFLNG